MAQMRNRNAIVTGGAGFIGSHLVDRMLKEGWKATVIDNFDPFYDRWIKEENIKDHLTHRNYRLLEKDITLRESLARDLDDTYDVIIHLAAKAGVRPSIQDPLSYQKVNVEGTQNMLELAKEKEIKQFVFASSSSVYGVNPNVPWSEEDHVLQPISPYASTKVSGELLGHVYSTLFDIRFVALRFFTVYGPRQRPDLAMHKFARLILNRDTIPFFGDGSTRRDYTYVDDIVKGIMGAISYNGSLFEVINLGNNETVSLSQMVSTLEQVLGVQAIKKMLPQQPGDVPQTWASIDKAKRLFGYEPKTDLHTGLTRFYNWLQQLNQHQLSITANTETS